MTDEGDEIPDWERYLLTGDPRNWVGSKWTPDDTARRALDPSVIKAAHARHKGHRTGIGESCIPLWEDRPPSVPPCLPYRLAERIAELEAAEGRVRAFEHEMRFYCSPYGVSVLYADRLLAALDGPPDDQQDRVLTAADVALARAATSASPNREDFSEFLDDTDDDQQDRKVPT